MLESSFIKNTVVAAFVLLVIWGLAEVFAPETELSAVTQQHYVFETSDPVKEVTFFSTSSDNPNNTAVQEVLNVAGRDSMLRTDSQIPETGFAASMPANVATDVWCKVAPRQGQFAILRVDCFQPGHASHGTGTYGEYDPSRMGVGGRRTVGYDDLRNFVSQLRGELRSLLTNKQAVAICIK